jgi:hypothetical protein
VVLAVLLVLIATQISRFLVPPAVPYPVSLLLAVAGLLAGEVLALIPRFSGPSLGVLHPVTDVITIAIGQAAGSFLLGNRSQRRGGDNRP